MSENVRQKRLTILEYFDAYICHHYQPTNDSVKTVALVYKNMIKAIN